MDHSAKLIAALALAFSGTVHAGYAQMKPPPGWSPGRYAPAANDAAYGRVIHSPNGPTTTVGGQSVKMPASYRLAANAPRVAAAAIYAHPYVRTGAAIAAWLAAAYLVWDSSQNKWVQSDTSFPRSDGQLWSDNPSAPAGQRQFSIEAACKSVIASRNSDPGNINAGASYAYTGADPSTGRCNMRLTQGAYTANDWVTIYNFGGSSCPTGWYVTPAGCVQSPPPKDVTQQEFEDALAPKPMPEKVPLELPQPTPLPIEQPSPWINPLPGPDPFHRPQFVPTGNPVPNPNYDPNSPPGPNNQPYSQPGTRVVPSPTPTEPWRVDHQPVNRPTPTQQPNPDPTTEPGSDPNDKPKPEEQQSLCEKHPDILACAKLGSPGQATPVPNENKTMAITPENGFGPASGTCPPPRTVQVAGLTLSMPFDLLCDFANGIKPVIVGLAWLTAAFTFMGIGRRS